MKNRLKTILNLLQSMGGLATGAVFSVLFAITLLASDAYPMDHTVLALAWIMVGFIMATGFYTARTQMKAEQEGLSLET